MLPHVACLARQPLLGVALWRTVQTVLLVVLSNAPVKVHNCAFAAWLYDNNFNYCYLRCFYLFARSNWDLSEVFSSLPLTTHFRFIILFPTVLNATGRRGVANREHWYVRREAFAVVDGTRTKVLRQARPGPWGYHGELGGIHSCFGLRGGVNSCSWSPDYLSANQYRETEEDRGDWICCHSLSRLRD